MFLSFLYLVLSETVSVGAPPPRYPSQVWAEYQSWSVSVGARPRLCGAPQALRQLQRLVPRPCPVGSDTLHLYPLHYCCQQSGPAENQATGRQSPQRGLVLGLSGEVEGGWQGQFLVCHAGSRATSLAHHSAPVQEPSGCHPSGKPAPLRSLPCCQTAPLPIQSEKKGKAKVEIINTGLLLK